MCGICVIIEKRNAIKSAISGLKKLEYRGYDSSGIAYLENGQIKTIKSIGQIKNLEEKISKELYADVAIAHTRWATHGKVSEENAHPQISENDEFAIVHNGIIENYQEIKNTYLKGTKFKSETDTEVFVNLIAKQNGDTLTKLKKASSLVKGSYAIALLNKNSNDIYLAKNGSPLYVAKNKYSCMAGSDISIFYKKYEKYYVLEDGEFAVINDKKINFYSKNGQKIKKNAIFIKNNDFFEEKLNEKYFMLKEIKEQSAILKKTFYNYFSENILSNKIIEKLKKYKQFHFIACGTAYHSCLIGAKYLQDFCRKETQVSIASEFRYNKNIFTKNCLYIFVSQSGETADTIACAKLVRANNCETMAVTNVPHSSLNKIVKFILPTFAGKEIAVASTKAYTAQLFTLLILAVLLSDDVEAKEKLKNFVLDFQPQDFNEDLLKKIKGFKKIFYIGRQQDYVTSLEGALKLKEIAYINCIGIQAGELKHGSLALVDEDTLVVAFATIESLQEKMESNIEEVKARGGKILAVSQLDLNIDCDYQIKLAKFDEFLMPIVSIVPMQLLAFKFSVELGYNPDMPRNLAKSVTVE